MSSGNSFAPKSWKDWLLAAIVAVWGMFLFLIPGDRPDFSDTAGYRSAGMKILQGLTPYDVHGHYTFNYPPFAAFSYGLFFGWGEVPAVGPWLWIFSLIGLFWIAVWSALRANAESPFRLFLILIAMAMLPLRDELKLGQTMVFAWLAVFLALFFYSKKEKSANWEWLAGIFFALAFQWKVYVALFFPLLLVRFSWRTLLTAGVAHLFLWNGWFLSLKIGWHRAFELQKEWLEYLPVVGKQFLGDRHNVSLRGVSFKLIGSPHVSTFVQIAATGAFAWFVWVSRKIEWEKIWPWAYAAAILLNPVAWPYWMLTALPLLAVRLSQIQNIRSALLFAPIPLAILLQDTHAVFWGGLTIPWLVWLCLEARVLLRKF
ncbi:MAG: DUF2029 domain-containing protein [Spirochaetia bacterium]|nr:DUF2029 domain-containing protein [Spirochaetia bacterium]